MPISNSIKEKIALEVIRVLVTRFDNFPENAGNNRNAPFHKAFLSAFSDRIEERVSDIPFFISLSSWMHGLNTTIGQTFFENIAHILCNGEKREYTSQRLGNLPITQTQRDNIGQIIANLSTSSIMPNLTNENNLLFSHYGTEIIDANDFSADVFVEDNNSITAIELKSVKPNSGEMKGEKQKILEGKAALYRLFPNKQIKFFIGFPFDSTVNSDKESVTSSNKTRFLAQIINMNKFFDPAETLLASELWDFLSGHSDTMEEILRTINAISTTEFLSQFRFISNSANRNDIEYQNILNEWFLCSEKELVENDATLRRKIQNNSSLTRIYNKCIFDSSYKYRFDRYNELKKII